MTANLKQRDEEFLVDVHEKVASGMSEREIADSLQLTVPEFRAVKATVKERVRYRAEQTKKIATDA